MSRSTSFFIQNGTNGVEVSQSAIQTPDPSTIKLIIKEMLYQILPSQATLQELDELSATVLDDVTSTYNNIVERVVRSMTTEEE